MQFLIPLIFSDSRLMRAFVMEVNIDRMSRVNDSISILHDFMVCVRMEVHIIVFVVLNDSTNSEKNKKNSSFLLDTMVIVVIYLSKKHENVSQNEKNIQSDSKYQRLKKLSSMTLFVDE